MTDAQLVFALHDKARTERLHSQNGKPWLQNRLAKRAVTNKNKSGRNTEHTEALAMEAIRPVSFPVVE